MWLVEEAEDKIGGSNVAGPRGKGQQRRYKSCSQLGQNLADQKTSMRAAQIVAGLARYSTAIGVEMCLGQGVEG